MLPFCIAVIMADEYLNCGPSRIGATPLHVRILEQTLSLDPFLNYAESELRELMNEPHVSFSQDNVPTFKENPPVPEGMNNIKISPVKISKIKKLFF